MQEKNTIYEVRLSYSANQDVDEIISYLKIRLVNATAATNFLDALEEKITLLEAQPYLFEKSRDDRLSQMGYRRFVIDNYIALYTVDDSKKLVVVARLFYGKRSCEKYL